MLTRAYRSGPPRRPRRSTPRRRGFRCWSAAAAAGGPRCCGSCASGSAAPPCSTSTSSVPRRRRSGFSARSRRCRRSRSADTSAPARRRARRVRRGAGVLRAARAPAASEPATFLLDEFLELRTFESFPGLRRVLHDFVDGLAASGNRFVLTSRYVARALRLLRDRSARFEVIHMPALTAEDTLDILGPTAPAPATMRARRRLPRAHRAGAGRRPPGVRPRARRRARARCASTAARAAATPISALAALLAPDGRLAKQCAFCYELRLHRARGYGALKAILEILGEEEGLTLTEISQRLQRTPGSTKDYLSWLEDVDLVDLAAEALQLHRSAAARLGAAALPPVGADRRRPRARSPPLRAAAAAADLGTAAAGAVRRAEPAFAMAGGPPSGIIEID